MAGKQRRLKRCLSAGLLTLFLHTTCIPIHAKAVAQNDNQQPALTFSVISDIHLRAGMNDKGYPYHDNQADHKFAHALQDLNHIDPSQDALVLNGDLTVTGMQSDYDCLHQVLRLNPHPAFTLYTIGNHEFYSAFRDKQGKANRWSFPNGVSEAQCIQRFLRNTGMPNVYYDKWIHGYHFIVLGSEKSRITNRRYNDDAILSESQLKWLDMQLRKSPPNQPAFVFLHQPILGSSVGTAAHDPTTVAKLQNILANKPQVIVFSGHSHRTLREQTQIVHRVGLEMFNDSSVGSPVNAFHRLVGDSEGLYVQVYANKVVVKGRDFTHQVWISQQTLPVIYSVPEDVWTNFGTKTTHCVEKRRDKTGSPVIS